MRKKTFAKGSLLMMTMLVSSNMMAGTPELEGNATSNAVKAHRVLVIGAQDIHYVNYSLYDGNKKKLAQGSNYFTSINPQSEQQMLKTSRKSTAKMLDDVESTLTAMRK